MDYKEIEVRFLEIDKEALLRKLRELNAEDHGEHLLEEQIIYDKELTWRNGPRRMLRLRTKDGKTQLTYKHRTAMTAEGTEEVEFEVSDAAAAAELLDRIGYSVYRHQQKKRHTFHLGDVVIDIDTWPRVPTYVELEGPSEDALKDTAKQLGLDWSSVEFRDPRTVIEEVYKIPLGTMRWFTFDRFE